METTRNVKMAMMAASALIAAAAAMTPAHASDFDAAAYPPVVEATVVAHAADQADQKSQNKTEKIALFAIGAGVVAALIRIIGAKKILRAAKETTVQAARVSGKVAGQAAKAVSRAIASPMRFALLISGLALFALTGVGLYDIEWIGGLVAGAAMTGVGAYGVIKTRMALKLQPIRVRSKTTVNRN